MTEVTDTKRHFYFSTLLASFERYNKTCPTGYEGALIKSAAELGRLMGKPPDLTCIAFTLGMNYSTLVRKAHEVERLGYIRIVEAWVEWDNVAGLMQLGHFLVAYSNNLDDDDDGAW